MDSKKPIFHCCERMETHLAHADLPLVYSDKFREYGIRYMDDSVSVQSMSFCPWCGAKLPASLRTVWFDELDRLGLEPEDDIPAEMKTGRWWRNKGI